LTGPAGVLAPPAPTQLRNFVESRGFTFAVTIVIAINAVTLGLETWPLAMQTAGPLLLALDRLALWFFTVEIGLKLWLYRGRFFRDAWSIFDFVIVAIAWLPSAGPLSVLRALRIVRALRLLTIVPQMRTVIGALFRALPGMGSVIAVLGLVFYVAAVMATKLFGADFPDWFGSIGGSMYSLFQVMTLESWSMGIVRPVMEQYPYAWLFFVPFIIVTSFAVLNLFIALIVNSMQSMQMETNENVRAEALAAHDEREALSRQIEALTDEIRQVREALRRG
jgi:voltage-gated sodium channel